MTSPVYEQSYFTVREDPRRAAMQRQELARLRERTRLEGGTVLDVGCGLGEFLEVFPPEPWKRYGIEVSEHAREICRAKGISFELPEGKGWCDLIVLLGSLQHLDRPIETLARCHEWLRPGGG